MSASITYAYDNDSSEIETDTVSSYDSDDTLKEIFSSSSYDRSSINSIPWAEDAIKQNQLEWERIERMFCGEEELPDEIDLRNEILEWRKAFPQRFVNKSTLKFKQNIPQLLSSSSSSSSSLSTIRSTRSPWITNHSNNRIFVSKPNREGNNEMIDRVLVEDLEKNLRISSVPILPQKRVLIQPSSKINTREISNRMKLSANSENVSNRRQRSLTSLSQIRQNVIPSGFAVGKFLTSSNSATTLRMPPITNIEVPNRNYLTHPATVTDKKTTNLLVSTKPIVLPIIQSFRIKQKNQQQQRKFNGIDDMQNFRSISAAINHRTTFDNYLSSRSASKLKNYD